MEGCYKFEVWQWPCFLLEISSGALEGLRDIASPLVTKILFHKMCSKSEIVILKFKNQKAYSYSFWGAVSIKQFMHSEGLHPPYSYTFSFNYTYILLATLNLKY